MAVALQQEQATPVSSRAGLRAKIFTCSLAPCCRAEVNVLLTFPEAATDKYTDRWSGIALADHWTD